MKNTIIILLLIICFILGVNSTSFSYSYNKLIESEKDYFETEITTPSNNYENKNLKPKTNIVNKVARGVDKLMNKLSNKINDITKGF